MTVDTLTVAEAVEELAAELPRAPADHLPRADDHLTTRIEVIVRFLALLELCKLGRVTLGQGQTFGQLQIDWIEGADLAAWPAVAGWRSSRVSRSTTTRMSG